MFLVFISLVRLNGKQQKIRELYKIYLEIGDVLDGAVVAVPLALDVHAGVWRGSLHDRAVVRRRCVRRGVVVATRGPRRSRSPH